jgi:hypothetical protein
VLTDFGLSKVMGDDTRAMTVCACGEREIDR